MAKRRKIKSYKIEGEIIGAGNEKLNTMAGDLGRILGTVHGTAWTWLKQRQAVIGELGKIRDTAVEMLSELGVPGDNGRGPRPARVKAASARAGRTVASDPASATKPATRKRPPATRKKTKAASKPTR